MRREELFELGDRVEALLNRFRSSLSPESADAVEHYLEHDEFELALEGLCIDLIEQERLKGDALEECITLGRKLNLDEESVLRADFWVLLMKQKED